MILLTVTGKTKDGPGKDRQRENAVMSNGGL